jgi:hypothetical protein
MRNPAESQDEYEDEEGRIWPKLKLAPYDKRRNELNALTAERDLIRGLGETTETDRQRLNELVSLIVTAQERFEREGKRALDDTFRKHRGIDDWRSGDGQEEYNATRRKVRLQANAKFPDGSDEKKLQHEKDMASDRSWRSRCRKAGWPEVRIQAELAVRLRAREVNQAAKVEGDAEEAAMRSDPTYGTF